MQLHSHALVQVTIRVQNTRKDAKISAIAKKKYQPYKGKGS